MSVNNEFPIPKDPQDSAWFSILFGEPLDNLIVLTVTPTMPDDSTGVGFFQTPGDLVAPSPLVASFGQISTDTLSVAFKLDGGAAGSTYAVRAGVATVAQSILYRSVIINVTGM